MKITRLHSWEMSPKEAIALQRDLADRVITDQPLGSYNLIAGVDVSHTRFSHVLFAGVVLWRKNDGVILEKHGVVRKTKFPYIPGLLSFREAPVMLEALAQLRQEPDVVMIDGHGFSHPRRFGIASHVGLWLDRPTLGCAKSRLCGEHSEPGPAPGSHSPLLDNGAEIGRMVRTKKKVKPVFASIGHRIDLDSAAQVVLNTCRGYRLPEPTRQAHLFVNELRRQAAES